MFQCQILLCTGFNHWFICNQQFLQNKEVPSDPLKLSLPKEVLHHQTAVLHYLRQNLQQLESLFHPKYQDAEHKFMDYTVSTDNATPMKESDTFLYNKIHNNSGEKRTCIKQFCLSV